MPDIIRIDDWHAPMRIGPHYQRLLQAMGTDSFGPAVRDAVMAVTRGARRLYLFEATGRQDSALHYFSCEPDVAALFPAYSSHYLRLDPAGDCYRAAPAHGDTVLLRLRPRDIASPGLRRRFYDEAGIVERVTIIQRGEQSWRGMNVARHRCDGELGDSELTSLIALASAVLPMLAVERQRHRPGRRLSKDELEERFIRHFPDLTRREVQVCARAAVGMSVEATAIDLGVAKSSILTYRRRAYQRLEVTSPFELSALVSR